MATSQLLCIRCGHSEDFHNWQVGPCCVKNCTPPANRPWATACGCYAFVSPHSKEFLSRVAYHEMTGFSNNVAVALATAEIKQRGQ